MTQDRPKFSIIVLAHSHASYLWQALDSLLAQTDHDWEAIVVHDGANDSTLEMLKSYAARDRRIKILDAAGSALNPGLQCARGQWICWLDANGYFEPRKLEIHRRHMESEPETSFFYTQFALLHDENHQLELASSLRVLPEREWQVLEMFRSNYVQTSSVCIKREALENTGEFDEALRYAQDYDMWLRLLVRYPATFINECTCVQRVSPNQTMHSSADAFYFDSARAAINLLNQCEFDQLFPLIDLTNPVVAERAAMRALDVAASFDSCLLYALGPHPALLWRIIEWVLHWGGNDTTNSIRKLVEKKVQTIAHNSNLDPAIRLQWKSTFAALRLTEGDFDYVPLSVDAIAKKRYWQLYAANNENLEALHQYLLQSGNKIDTVLPYPGSSIPASEVVLVGQKGARVDSPIKYGAARAWSELAYYLTRVGRPVLLIGYSEQRLGFTEDVLYLGVQTEDGLLRALRLLSPLDSLIGISRADIFLEPIVVRPLIYQHGPHLPMGDYAVSLIRRLDIPVLVVSRDSMRYQIQHAVPGNQIHLVYNGYDSEVFKFDEESLRAPHRIIFAGAGVFYKGLDIAVQAFLNLRDDFPDAEFYIFGRNHTWLDDPDHLWPAGWLNPQGYPAWAKIEEQVQGLKYMGEVNQSDLAEALQRCSLLVMPSRVYETFGLVSVEAQACGCIPVLPKQGGFPETLQQGLTGYLYDNNTVEDLTRVIYNLWDESLPTVEQRREAARWVQQNFSWEATGEQIAAILDLSPMGKHELAFSLERLFWKIAVRSKVKIRNLYKQIRSPILRRLLKLSYAFIREFTTRP